MGVIFSRSLFIKQAILTLVLAIVLSLISSVVQVNEGIQSEKKKIDQNFDELLAVVEKPLAEGLFRLDWTFVQQQIDSLSLNPSIAKVEIRDETGILLVESAAEVREFSVSQPLADYFLSDLQQYKRPLQMEAPIFIAGSLFVTPEKRFLLDRIFTEHLSTLIYNLFKDVLLASLISVFFYFLVTHPLMRLTESLSSLDRKEKLFLPESFYRMHRSDELGHLHTTFSKLLHKLNAALSDLERSDSHTRAMIEHAADGILLLDENHKITLTNTAIENMLKMKGADIKLHSLETLHAPSSWTVFSDVLTILPFNSPLTIETTYQRQGVEFPVEIRLAKYEVQKKYETLLLIRDISKRKAAEAHIHHLAYYDAITGLPNRQYLTDKLNDLFAKRKNSEECSAVIFMDLDRFKVINDSLGHNVGDQLLRCVAAQLDYLKNDNILFARMGGDEFAFLLSDLGKNREQAEKVISSFSESIIYACQQVKKAGHHDIHITASLGASIFDSTCGSVETILKQADTALYRAKESGRNTFTLYQSEMQAVSDRRLEMEKALHHAAEFKLFELYYQPQVNDKNGVIGAEALIRWKDENRGFISPAEFIPIAEEIGLIVDIGDWVLNEALSQVATWLKNGEWELSWRMSINVSPIQFQQASFLPMLKNQLEKHGVPACCVDLELTENMLLSDLPSCLEKMNAIKALGVHLSIDDFGTGYSSLKYLKLLPVDRLKIDQSFVRDLLTDKSDSAIVHAVIAMAKALNMSVIAEGVETLDHYNCLRETDCFYYQGYYFGFPVPAKDFIALFVHDSSTLRSLL